VTRRAARGYARSPIRVQGTAQRLSVSVLERFRQAPQEVRKPRSSCNGCLPIRLKRVCGLALLSSEARSRTTLRAIDVLVIAPSQRLDDIAARHISSLPRAVRSLLSAVGVRGRNGHEPSGAALASYLLFEAPYTGELIALGERDTLARRAEVLRFFGSGRRSSVTADASSIGTMPGAGANEAASARRAAWRVAGRPRVDQARTTDPRIS